MGKKLEGNGLWESSRMILPEHKEALIKHREETVMAKPKRPTRDEFELEELANKLMEAYNEKTELVLTVWGEPEPIRGRIVKLDPDTKRVHVQRFGEVKKIPFLDIMKAESPER